MMRSGALAQRLRAQRDRLLLAIDLLLHRRAIIVLVVDGLVILNVAVLMLTGAELGPGLYFSVVVPFLILGVPVLSDMVGLERRAGSLDIALTSPGARFYFERRVLAFGICMVAQGWLLLIAGRLFVDNFALVPPLVQTVVTVALLGSATLFWAVRLRSSGAVVLATLLSVAVISPWFFANPVYVGAFVATDEILFFTHPKWMLEWGKPNLVMLLSAIIFYLYARRRLDRPATLLS